MKTIKNLLPMLLFVMSFTAFGQNDNDFVELVRDVLNSEKKVAVANAMDLSTAESDAFWSLYNEYQAKLYEVQNKRITLVRDLTENLEDMSDDKADMLWVSYLKYQKKITKLKGIYYKKFKKILPAGKAARFFQIENKIEALVNAQLAMEIPLLDITKN